MKKFENIEQIKTERQTQRENPIIYSLLGVLLGELDRLPIPRTQSPSEDQIYAIIKKMHEAAKEMREMTPDADQEYMYLKEYIKQQLTSEDIINIITGLKANFNCNIGFVMKYFKDNYSGQYDGKFVSKIVKEMI